jgi:hypothetical protein
LDHGFDWAGDVPDVDVHASLYAAVSEPECDELASGEVDPDDDLVVAAGGDVAEVFMPRSYWSM